MKRKVVSDMNEKTNNETPTNTIIIDDSQKPRTITELINAVPDYGITKEGLETFLSKFETIPDCTTKAGYDLTKAGIAEMVHRRNRVKDRTTELSRALNTKKKDVQVGGESIQEKIAEAEERWKLSKKKIDDEKARVKKEKEEKAAKWREQQQSVITEIKELSNVPYGEPVGQIETRLLALSSIEIVESFFDPKTDFFINARAEKETCKVLLERILDTAKLKEKEEQEKEEAAEKLRIETEKLEKEKAEFEAEKREKEEKEKEEERERKAKIDAEDAERKRKNDEEEAERAMLRKQNWQQSEKKSQTKRRRRKKRSEIARQSSVLRSRPMRRRDWKMKKRVPIFKRKKKMLRK
jgi:hypothetical protein